MDDARQRAAEQQITDEIRSMAADTTDEFRPYALAWADLGYLVTEANQHTFTTAEISAFLDQVAVYQDVADRESSDQAQVD